MEEAPVGWRYRSSVCYLGPGEKTSAPQKHKPQFRCGRAAMIRTAPQQVGGLDIDPEHPFQLARMAARLEAARQLNRHAPSLASARHSALLAASMATAFASEVAEEICF